MHKNKSLLSVALVLSLLLVLVVSFTNVSAGNATLTLNSGSSNVRWFITGESSLVINGFDLDNFQVPRPTQVDKISISVLKTVPGKTVEAVVYQDSNGGSPSDARLVARKTVDIQTTGVVSISFDAPLNITERFLWVGFYLPVGFEFNGDRSGTSPLTYWGWTPNSTFDLANLASAAVLGPADGSAPVTLNMNGKARINVEVNTTGLAATLVPATPIRQIAGDPATSLTPLTQYNECLGLYYDRDDILVTYQDGVDFYCKIVPTQLRPESLPGYNRQGSLYDVYVFGVLSGTDPLPESVTHCIKPASVDLDKAVIVLGYGAPRQWKALPSVRFGEFVCAELDYAGFVSYAIPR